MKTYLIHNRQALQIARGIFAIGITVGPLGFAGYLGAGCSSNGPIQDTAFPCGDSLYCHSASEYCETTTYGDVMGDAGQPPSYGCASLPDACIPATCDCLQEAGVACSFQCSGSSDDGLTLRCDTL